MLLIYFWNFLYFWNVHFTSKMSALLFMVFTWGPNSSIFFARWLLILQSLYTNQVNNLFQLASFGDLLLAVSRFWQFHFRFNFAFLYHKQRGNSGYPYCTRPDRKPRIFSSLSNFYIFSAITVTGFPICSDHWNPELLRLVITRQLRHFLTTAHVDNDFPQAAFFFFLFSYILLQVPLWARMRDKVLVTNFSINFCQNPTNQPKISIFLLNSIP